MPRQKSIVTIIRDLVRSEIRKALAGLFGGLGVTPGGATPKRRRRRRRRKGAAAWPTARPTAGPQAKGRGAVLVLSPEFAVAASDGRGGVSMRVAFGVRDPAGGDARVDGVRAFSAAGPRRHRHEPSGQAPLRVRGGRRDVGLYLGGVMVGTEAALLLVPG